MKKLPIVLLLALSSLAPLARAASAAPEPLSASIRKIARSAKGSVGVHAVYLPTGESVAVGADERFAMASVFKLPIALFTLHRVDEGKESLERSITIRESDLRLGYDEHPELAGQTRTILQLLDVMMVESDNTACDILLREEGGPKAVEAYLKSLGVDAIDVSWSELDMAAASVGLPAPGEEGRSLESQRKLWRGVPAPAKRRAERSFEADPRNTATPEAATLLLAKVAKGEALKRETNTLLLDMMRRCKTGVKRIRGLLPEGTEVLDKTGTMGKHSNDIGLVTLPDGRGQVALAVFVRGSAPQAAREKVIARIARVVYDHYAGAARVSR